LPGVDVPLVNSSFDIFALVDIVVGAVYEIPDGLLIVNNLFVILTNPSFLGEVDEGVIIPSLPR